MLLGDINKECYIYHDSVEILTPCDMLQDVQQHRAHCWANVMCKQLRQLATSDSSRWPVERGPHSTEIIWGYYNVRHACNVKSVLYSHVPAADLSLNILWQCCVQMYTDIKKCCFWLCFVIRSQCTSGTDVGNSPLWLRTWHQSSSWRTDLNHLRTRSADNWYKCH